MQKLVCFIEIGLCAAHDLCPGQPRKAENKVKFQPLNRHKLIPATGLTFLKSVHDRCMNEFMDANIHTQKKTIAKNNNNTPKNINNT